MLQEHFRQWTFSLSGLLPSFNIYECILNLFLLGLFPKLEELCIFFTINHQKTKDRMSPFCTLFWLKMEKTVHISHSNRLLLQWSRLHPFSSRRKGPLQGHHEIWTLILLKILKCLLPDKIPCFFQRSSVDDFLNFFFFCLRSLKLLQLAHALYPSHC